MDERIVVTGMGAVTAVGGTAAKNLGIPHRGGSRASKTISIFDPGRLSVRIAAEVSDWKPEELHAPQGCATNGPVLTVRHRCLERGCGERWLRRRVRWLRSGRRDDWHRHRRDCPRPRNSFRILDSRGPDRVSPFAVPMMLPNMGSGQVSIALQARGPNLAPMSACSSAADALGLAAETIRRKRSGCDGRWRRRSAAL